jgi:preprotein translocase subunit SecG
MQNVILAIHILACLAMIGLVLVQKSEGGGLGIGGGGANSLMSGRGATGAIVRMTIIIGGIFFATSLALTSIANRSSGTPSGIERALEEAAPGGVITDTEDLFDPSVPLIDQPAAPAPDASAVPSAPTAETPADPGTAPAESAADPAETPTNPQ